MKAGQSQEKKKEKVTTLLPTMSESKLCEKRGGREREREGRREKRENGIIVFQESFVHVHCAPFQLRRLKYWTQLWLVLLEDLSQS